MPGKRVVVKDGVCAEVYVRGYVCGWVTNCLLKGQTCIWTDSKSGSLVACQGEPRT